MSENIQDRQAYSLMDRTVQIENGFHKNDQVKLPWWSHNDLFNEIRHDYGLKPYHEAVEDARFTLNTSTNDDDTYYAKLDLKALSHIKNARYVTYGYTSYIPATAKDIIPFLRDLKNHDNPFVSYLKD